MPLVAVSEAGHTPSYASSLLPRTKASPGEVSQAWTVSVGSQLIGLLDPRKH